MRTICIRNCVLNVQVVTVATFNGYVLWFQRVTSHDERSNEGLKDVRESKWWKVLRRLLC